MEVCVCVCVCGGGGSIAINGFKMFTSKSCGFIKCTMAEASIL